MKKNIDLILRVKLIIIIIIIIIINLGQASPSRPMNIEDGKGCLTQVAWVCQGRRQKSLWFYSPAWPNILRSGV